MLVDGAVVDEVDGAVGTVVSGTTVTGGGVRIGAGTTLLVQGPAQSPGTLVFELAGPMTVSSRRRGSYSAAVSTCSIGPGSGKPTTSVPANASFMNEEKAIAG